VFVPLRSRRTNRGSFCVPPAIVHGELIRGAPCGAGSAADRLRPQTYSSVGEDFGWFRRFFVADFRAGLVLRKILAMKPGQAFTMPLMMVRPAWRNDSANSRKPSRCWPIRKRSSCTSLASSSWAAIFDQRASTL
jgi:hypothetical protein